MAKKPVVQADKALAKPAATEVGSPIPEYLRGGGGRGAEKVRQKDLIIPRIKLLQGNNPEVIQSKGKIQPGYMSNSVTGEVYGDKFLFVPILFFVSRIMWRKKDGDEGGGILCQARDGENPQQPLPELPKGQHCGPVCSACPMALWDDLAKTKKEKQPKCTEYYNFIGYVKGHNQPIVLSMERTKVPAAKKILSLNRYSGDNLDLFSRYYNIMATGPHDDGAGNMYFSIDAEGGPWVTAEEHKMLGGQYDSLRKITFQVHNDDQVTPEAPKGKARKDADNI